MVKIFLTGISGKMGKTICRYAEESGCASISGGLDTADAPDYPTFRRAADVNVDFDVIADFSRPQTLDEVIALSDRYERPVIIATTGYDENGMKKIEALSKRRAVLMSGNMSFGVTLLTALLEKAAAALGDGFDAEIVEKHHNQKADAPSGTSLMLARSVQSARPESRIICGRSGANCKRGKNDISISSVRGGTVVGEHEVMFLGNDEIITLSHSAFSRKIFAVGAVKAAKFLIGKKPALYGMRDVLGL
ncbi:MAG: 4-hydroxy-tetrahydrodipicolinate reductase [Clostridia bacterium]|nr:4-hydroxy-tetrahydrodipicolinate reductase [Clostridia bacterium]